MKRVGLRNRRSLAPAGLCAIACITPIVAGVRFLGRGSHLVGDIALLDLQVRDLIHGHFPLVGFYSRFGWNHPGPALFYVLAPFRILSGGASWGIVLGAIVWSIASVIATTYFAQRRGGTAVDAMCLAAHLTTWIAIGGRATVEPWTPHFAAAMLIPFLVCAWGFAESDRAATFATLVIGSLMVQIHVGYALIVGAVVFAASIARQLRREKMLRRDLRNHVLTIVVLWAPVALDAATHNGGNLRKLLDYFTSGAQSSPGLSGGFRIIASEMHPWPAWIFGPTHAANGIGVASQANAGWLVAFSAVCIVITIVVQRTRDALSMSALIVAGSALLAGIVAASQVRGNVYAYVLYWRSPLVAFAFAVIAMTVGRAILRNVANSKQLASAACVLLVVAGSVSTTRAVTRLDTISPGEILGRSLADASRPQARRARTITLQLANTSLKGALTALMHDYQEHGITARAPATMSWIFGATNTASTSSDGVVWFVSEDPTITALYKAQLGARLIAEVTPLTTDESRILQSQVQIVALQLRAAGRLDLIPAIGTQLGGLALARVRGVDLQLEQQIANLSTKFATSAASYGAIIAFDAASIPTPWWPGPGNAG